jgi:outer membrane protein
MPGRLKKIAGCLVLGLATLAPLSAQPPEVAPIQPQKGRVIANPEELAPPRVVPLEESLPSVTDPTKAQELLHLDLRTAMGRVLEETPTLKKISSRIQQADYRVQEAFTSAYPTLDFQSQYSRVQPPIALPTGIVISPADNYQFRLVLRQAIYDFGRMKWNVLARKLAMRAVQEEYRTELNRLILLVAQRYIEAVLAQERVLIAQDDLEAQLANLRTSQLLYEQGVAARFDVLRNSAAASQAQQILIEAETSETIAKARLLSLLDQPLDRKLQLDALPLRAPNKDLQLSDSKLMALETRPDLRTLRWAVQEAKAQVEVAETSNNPLLELTNTTVNQNATGFSPETQNTTAIVLSVPLYDGGVSHWQKEQAQESVNQITLDLEQAERDAVLQIDEVYHQLSDRWRAIAVAEENVTQAEEALRVAVLRYENGISTNVELLESQAARSRARFELAQARGNYLQSRWNWWQATAGEYPTEVPLPEEIRARLDAEGLPNGVDAFSGEETGEKLGPLLPTRESPVLPIRGLPTPESEDGVTSPADSPDPK